MTSLASVYLQTKRNYAASSKKQGIQIRRKVTSASTQGISCSRNSSRSTDKEEHDTNETNETNETNDNDSSSATRIPRRSRSHEYEQEQDHFVCDDIELQLEHEFEHEHEISLHAHERGNANAKLQSACQSSQPWRQRWKSCLQQVSSPPPPPSLLRTNRSSPSYKRDSVRDRSDHLDHHPNADPEDADDLETKFVQQIKVAGMRPTRERILIESFHRAVATYEHTTSHLSNALNQWMDYAHILKGTFGKAMETMEVEYQSKLKTEAQRHNIIEQQLDENRIWEDEVEQLRKELQHTASEKDALVQQHEGEMNAFLDQMEAQVDAIQNRMVEDARKVRKEVEHELEEQFQERMCELKTMEVERRESERRVLEEERERCKDASNDCRAQMKEAQAALKQSNEDNKCLEMQLQNAREEMESMAETHAMELKCESDNCTKRWREERDQELAEVEHRVKLVLDTKEKALQCALRNARGWEDKAHAFERCISKLENDLLSSTCSSGSREEPVPPCPPQDHTCI